MCELRLFRLLSIKLPNNDLFAYLLAMKNLIQHHSHSFVQDWNDFLMTLEEQLMEKSNIILSSKIGLPSNWKDILWIG